MLYNDILQRALDRVPNSYSKRLDSPIYNGVAPSSYVIADLYNYIDQEKQQKFAVTATGEALDKICYESGVERFPATTTLIKAEFLDINTEKMDVPIGSRVATADIIFKVLSKESTGVCFLESEDVGEATAYVTGDIVAIDNIPGLATIKLLEIITSGMDAEADDQLRGRFYIKVREPATSGNIYHYKLWATEVQGVGNARVFPLRNGPGTVEILIVDTDMELPSAELIEKVGSYIEQVRPIGATVTISAPTKIEITVSAQVSITTGADILNVKNRFNKVLKEYFKSTIFDANINYISYAKVGSLLLSLPDVLDYSELLLNGGKSNIEILDTSIASLASVDLEG